MDFLNTIMRGRLKSLFSKDFARWKTTFENLVMLHDPNLWIYITQPYEKPRRAGSVSFKMVNQMSATERENFNVEKKTFETILACLPNDEASCFRTQETSFDLWNSLEVSNGSNTNLRITSSDEGMKEELIKKEEEIKALQSKILTMENEREETRLKIIGIEKKEEEIKNLQSQLFNMETEREAMRSKIVELEEHVKLFEVKQKLVTKLQQPIVVKLIEDKELALKTIEDLRKKIDNISQSPRSPVKNKKKICTDKSSELFRAKKISQFTNYSLHKNNKYSEKSQSTRQRNHQKVDCRDNSGNIKCNKSSASTSLKKSRDLKPTLQPESIRTKSYAYTREQMFAFAPPRFHHMVQNRRKDFASFSWRTSVRRNEFRNVTRCLNFRWNSMSLDFIDESYRKVSKLSRKIGTVLKWVPKVKI